MQSSTKSQDNVSSQAQLNDIAKWFVYILRTKKGRLYTGITTDVQRRLSEHQNSNSKGAKFFRSDKAEALVLVERGFNRSTASIREAEIKKLDRSQKLSLIRLQSPLYFSDTSAS
ncbi:GIY-YIG nuclease family protein [Aurantivibrio infirmus]